MPFDLLSMAGYVGLEHLVSVVFERLFHLVNSCNFFGCLCAYTIEVFKGILT